MMRGSRLRLLIFVSWVSSVFLSGCSGDSSSVKNQTLGGSDTITAYQKMVSGKMSSLFSWFQSAEPDPITIAKLAPFGGLEN